jgi:hypothetical protein
MIHADYLLGRRFMFPGGEADDVTIVAVDPQGNTVRAHCLDGGRATLPLRDVIEAIETGAMEESETGAPFVLPDPADETQITIRRHGRTVMVPLLDVLPGGRS